MSTRVNTRGKGVQRFAPAFPCLDAALGPARVMGGSCQIYATLAPDGTVKRRDDLTFTFRATGKLPSGGFAVTDASVPGTVRER